MFQDSSIRKNVSIKEHKGSIWKNKWVISKQGKTTQGLLWLIFPTWEEGWSAPFQSQQPASGPEN